MRFTDDFLYELRARNDIESVVSSYVVLKKRGNTLVGLCPFHNEKTPSFTVYPHNGSYYCFGCNAGGDVITFVRAAENLDYPEAVRFLADRAGIPMPERGADDSMHKLRMTIYAANKEAARFFYNCLMSPQGEAARRYLESRKIAPAVVRRFGLGYAPPGWTELYEHLTAKGFSPADLVQADLIRKGGRSGFYDRFVNRLMFPIIDLRGNVLGFGGRVLPGDPKGDKAAKYLNTGDTPVYKKSRNLYALNLAKNAPGDRLILTEGYMDTIALHQAGFDSAVAALGTAFTPEQAKLLSRYAKEVVVTLDADESGLKATRRALDILASTGLSVRVLRIPDGKDPDEYIKTHGPLRFKALLEGAGDDIGFRLSEIRAKHDLQSGSGKIAYLTEALQMLAGLDNEIAADIYAAKLTEECGVSRNAVDAQLKTFRRKIWSERRKNRFSEAARVYVRDRINPVLPENLRAHKAEEKLLSLLMRHPDLYPEVRNLAPEHFSSEFHARVYRAVTALLERGSEPGLSLLSADFPPDEMGHLAKLQNAPLPRENAENELKDCIAVILEENEKKRAKSGDLDDEAFLRRMEALKERKAKESTR